MHMRRDLGTTLRLFTLHKQSFIKVPMNRKLFFFSFKVCLKKYTFPKFEKSRRKIDDFTSLQIRAFLPSKMVFESARPKYHVISISNVTLVPQSFSQYGAQERKEEARAVLRCWYTKPTKLLSESLDMFSTIFSHLPTRNCDSANKLMAPK